MADFRVGFTFYSKRNAPQPVFYKSFLLNISSSTAFYVNEREQSAQFLRDKLMCSSIKLHASLIASPKGSRAEAKG